MKILVAGGAGYVGSCCVEYLLDNGHEVTVLDSLVKGHRAAVDSRATFIEADLADTKRLETVFKSSGIEGVIHFAAFIEVGESMAVPGRYFRNNVCCGINLLNAAVRHGVKKIVFSSTAAVYGAPENVPIPETAAKDPINPYGESKLMFERILRWYHEVYGLPYAALRYFNAAGATVHFGEDHDPESHLIPIIFQTLTGQRDSISIFGDDYATRDGTCVRDYVHVLDLAQAHLLALESDEAGSFNLGSGSGHSVREVIDAVEAVTGQKVPAVVSARRTGDPAQLISDSTKAKRKLCWHPCHDSLTDIVESAWKWRNCHPEGYAN